MVITKRFEWDMAHRLPNHAGKCRHLHGHRYVAEIDVTGPVLPAGSGSSSGMVLDFGVIKDFVNVAIGSWDHKLMLWGQDPLASAFMQDVFEDAGVMFVSYVPTAENIAKEIAELLRLSGLNVTRVRVYETPTGWAEWKI